MAVLRVLVVLLLSVVPSECVRCFASFNRTSAQCTEELGEAPEDDCCYNPLYAYETPGGACQFCGPPVWSPWSSWSQCSNLCGKGVRQRKRACHGIGEPQCENPADKLQIEPCTGVCCSDEGWESWTPWASCSISCGEGGTRVRTRKCRSKPECSSACAGPSEETEKCPPQNICPVHGGWGSWSSWSSCSGSCNDDQRGQRPSKQRSRSCSNPPPSDDTVPPGDRCRGDGVQEALCSELPNCPVDGNWGPWSPPGPCSTTCGEGLQISTRTCTNPTPKYGGRLCDGSSARASACQSLCPVDGFWSGWSGWSDCSAACISQNTVPTRSRSRSCTNPAPSSSPPGTPCPGEDQQTDSCHHLPPCAVDGVWGSWSPYTPCPVTCGVGAQVSVRSCDSPAPIHGGQPCAGERRRVQTCSVKVHCPVDGVWSEWAPWGPCVYPFRKDRVIRCEKVGGSQTRDHQCLHQAHNGSICSGENLTEKRVCYDVSNCPIKGTWEGWEPWASCRPLCGGKSARARRRYCKPNYEGYSPTIGRSKEPANFFGTPLGLCEDLPKGEQRFEKEECLVPACA